MRAAVRRTLAWGVLGGGPARQSQSGMDADWVPQSWVMSSLPEVRRDGFRLAKRDLGDHGVHPAPEDRVRFPHFCHVLLRRGRVCGKEVDGPA